MLKFLRGNRHERAGYELYGASVAAAREPYFYVELGVADTIDGRFDLVCLHVFLLIRALGRHKPQGPELGQAVFDAMFSDMDINLREMGVGDMSIAKKVKKMWEAFHGRADAYELAVAAADPAALAAALTRNVWRGTAPVGSAQRLAGIALAQDTYLAGQALDSLAAGRVVFLPAATAGL